MYLIGLIRHVPINGGVIIMPIVDMRFENGIFFAREYGQIEEGDAQLWADTLRSYAQASPAPIVVLVDAREVTAVTRAAGEVFAQATQTPNVRVSAVAAGSAVMAQVSRNITLHAKRNSSYIFMDFDEALNFAKEQAARIDG
jgi:hypothetical protein